MLGVLSLSLFSFLISATAPVVDPAICATGLLKIAMDHHLNFPILKGMDVRDFKELEMKKITGVKREIQVVELSTVSDETSFLESDLFTDGPADLIIGVDANGNTQGHMYLMIRADDIPSIDPELKEKQLTIRYDGRLFRRDYQIKANGRLSNGLFLRYKNVPPELRHRILKFWIKGEKNIAWSCVASAVKMLYDIGGFTGKPSRGKFFPSPYLKHLARNGLMDSEGNRLIPQIYALNRPAEQFWNRLPDLFKMWSFIIPLLTNPATWGKAQFKA